MAKFLSKFPKIEIYKIHFSETNDQDKLIFEDNNGRTFLLHLPRPCSPTFLQTPSFSVFSGEMSTDAHVRRENVRSSFSTNTAPSLLKIEDRTPTSQGFQAYESQLY